MQILFERFFILFLFLRRFIIKSKTNFMVAENETHKKLYKHATLKQRTLHYINIVTLDGFRRQYLAQNMIPTDLFGWEYGWRRYIEAIFCNIQCSTQTLAPELLSVFFYLQIRAKNGFAQKFQSFI